MRKIVYVLLGTISVIFLCSSCNKNNEYVPEPEPVAENNYLMVNGVENSKLYCAFAYEYSSYKTGIQTPGDPIGKGYEIGLYNDNYSKYPGPARKANVVVSGVFHFDKTYKSAADCIDFITLSNLPNISLLRIVLNQGIFKGVDNETNKDAYDGDNELVSSVVIDTFDGVGPFRNKDNNVTVHIKIVLKDSTIIEFNYKGAVSYDLDDVA